MSSFPTLPADLRDRVLTRFGVAAGLPSPAHLNDLIYAYTRHVPWESASRIARRAQMATTADCPRQPVEFWELALSEGSGGTCFESNAAFFSLLQSLGYDGYLTINDMPPKVACHTAIVIQLDGQKWLVDAGLPVFVPIPLDPNGPSRCESPFLDYVVTPADNDHYRVQRHPHPKHEAFTLIDRPVTWPAYLAATTADYEPAGLFLNEVVLNKIVGGRFWRPTTVSFGSTSPSISVPI